MAKKRIYEIAKERGIATQELAERLRAAGVEVKSNLASVEESDVDRVLAAGITTTPSEAAPPPRKVPGSKAARAGAPADRPAPSAGPKPPIGPRIVATAEELRAKEQAARGAKGSSARKGRGRRPRLEDLPTVVGPGVPVRKGVKPSGTVLRKGEEPKPTPAPAAPVKPAPPPAKPAAGPKGKGGVSPKAVRGSVPVVPPLRPVDDSGKGAESGARGSVKRRGSGETAGARTWKPSDKPTRRRVVIDSQAGRKTKPSGRDKKGAPVVEVERAPVKKKAAPGTESPVIIASGATVKDLAEALELPAGEIIKTLMKLGEMVTITQSLSDEAILIVGEEFERLIEIKHAEDESAEPVFVDDAADLEERAPVVTIMGHVDHGKTSLLDAIRETEVAKGEAGGITQHIGAYQVRRRGKIVTFIDTPGHEAFTAMRARGAKVTDIAVIVVAANDGVMPQTIEAIHHAKAAEVPIVVAINKIDLEDANPERVMQQLSDQGLVPEAWGGDTVMVQVSAKKRLNLDELMDMLLLVAEVQELKANPKAPASGVVIEAQLDVGRGPVATVLVQRGTLRVGDAVVSGEAYGKVKAMFDFMGEPMDHAGPAVPAQILGFNTVPVAGEFVMVVKDEREARHRAESRTSRIRQEMLAKGRAGAASLDDFYRRLKEGAVKELVLIIKGDVGGSVEALEEALNNVSHPEVKVRVIHSGVGGVNESDVMLAAASGAVIIGFNVRPSAAAKSLAENEGVDIRTYRVIYKAIEDVQAALAGMLEPEHIEEEVGSAEVRQIFRASRVGTIAGCYVQTGKITRSAKVRVVRNGQIVHEGTVASLKRFNDDVREVPAGYECGLHVDGFDDIKEGDIIEAYEIKEVARTE